MAKMNSKVIGIIAIATTAVTLLMVIISLAIPYWLVIETSEKTANLGLWRACVEASGHKICVDTDELMQLAVWNKDKNNATKAFMIIALLVILVALVVGVLVTFVMKKPILAFVAMGCAISGTVCLLIAVAVYASMAHDADRGDDLDAAFALANVAMVMALGDGILFLLLNRATAQMLSE